MSDNKSQKDSVMSFAARRAAKHSHFLEAALESYRQHEGLEQAELATYLGLPPKQLERLALCARPDLAEPTLFRTQLAAICTRFSIPLAPLANLLRRVAAYEAESTPTNLMAARDHEEEPSRDE